MMRYSRIARAILLVGLLAPMPLAAGMFTATAQAAISQDVEIDLEMAGLERAISHNDHAAVLQHIEALRRLDPSLDEGELYFFEARAASNLDEVHRAYDALTRFLANADRDSPLYNEALHLMLDIRPAKAAADAETRRLEEEAQEMARVRIEEAERRRAAEAATPTTTVGPPGTSNWLALDGNHCLIVVASRRTVDEASSFISLELPRSLRDGAYVFESANGWYAIAVGAVRREAAVAEIQRLISSYGIPSDSFCRGTDGLVREIAENEAAEGMGGFAATHRVFSQQTGFLNLRSGPGNDHPVIGRMDNGTMVAMTSDQRGGWVRVQTSDGQDGWAYSRYLQQR